MRHASQQWSPNLCSPSSRPAAPPAAAARAVRLLAVALAAALAGCGDDPVRPDVQQLAGIRPALSGGSVVGFTQVSAGNVHTCGLKTDATVACWGAGITNEGRFPNYGQAAPPAGTFTLVSAGRYHNCAVKTDRAIACWGNNADGEAAAPAGAFTYVSAGFFHTCAVKTDGTAACWGWNGDGQAAPPAGAFTRVSAGVRHTCALNGDGAVACWGNSDYGQAVPPAGAFTEMSAGWYHTCAVKADGTAVCWGRNESGEASPPAGAFIRVSAGYEHSCGVKTDGSVACWGRNDFGEASPPAGTFTLVSAGGRHTCGVKVDGTAACWGYNAYGQATPPAPRAPQAIEFTSPPPNPAVLGGSHTVSATGGGSGNVVILTSLTPAVCPLSGATLSFAAVGTCTVAADQAGNASYLDAPRATQTFAVVYHFGATTGGGFAPPVSNTTVNSTRAGQSVPVKFDLGGDQGLQVLAFGYPKSMAIACPSGGDPLNQVDATTTAGESGLTYDTTTGLYTYVWKTDRTWAGTCREFVLKLADNTEHRARFQFAR